MHDKTFSLPINLTFHHLQFDRRPIVTKDSNTEKQRMIILKFYVSILLVWCDPSVWKMQQSNLFQNNNDNTMRLAKKSTVAL